MAAPPNPCRGFRFPVEVIEHAVWLYHCFSLRDVEIILAARDDAFRTWREVAGIAPAA